MALGTCFDKPKKGWGGGDVKVSARKDVCLHHIWRSFWEDKGQFLHLACRLKSIGIFDAKFFFFLSMDNNNCTQSPKDKRTNSLWCLRASIFLRWNIALKFESPLKPHFP